MKKLGNELVKKEKWPNLAFKNPQNTQSLFRFALYLTEESKLDECLRLTNNKRSNLTDLTTFVWLSGLNLKFYGQTI